MGSGEGGGGVHAPVTALSRRVTRDEGVGGGRPDTDWCAGC
jgi:hypothetical protein